MTSRRFLKRRARFNPARDPLPSQSSLQRFTRTGSLSKTRFSSIDGPSGAARRGPAGLCCVHTRSVNQGRPEFLKALVPEDAKEAIGGAGQAVESGGGELRCSRDGRL